MATRTISNTGGNYNTTGAWVEGIVPTASDDIIATATSGNLSITATAVCKSADFTGYVAILNHGAFNWSIGTTSGGGTLKFVAGMTYTIPASNNCKVTLVNTSSTANITSAGKSFKNFIVNGSGCNCVIQDNITFINSLLLSNGVIDFNDKNVSSVNGSLTFNAGTATMRSGTFSINGLVMSTAVVGNINAGTSNVILVGSGSVLQPEGNPLYNLTINSTDVTLIDEVSYTGVLVINGPCVVSLLSEFTTGQLDLLAPSTVTFNSSAGNIIQFKSLSAGNQTNIVGDGTSTYTFNWLKLTDSAASSGTFIAKNSIDGGNNSGWTITAPSTNQSSGGISMAYPGSSHHQSTGGLSGGLSSAHVQSTGELT